MIITEYKAWQPVVAPESQFKLAINLMTAFLSMGLLFGYIFTVLASIPAMGV